ncbi:MAG: hypothetical protein ACI80H_000129, partial [Pseudoalteromonas distincta]
YSFCFWSFAFRQIRDFLSAEAKRRRIHPIQTTILRGVDLWFTPFVFALLPLGKLEISYPPWRIHHNKLTSKRAGTEPALFFSRVFDKIVFT